MISAMPDGRGGDAGEHNRPPVIMDGPDKPGHDDL